MARNPAKHRKRKKWQAEKKKNLNLWKATKMFDETSSIANDNEATESPKGRPDESCEIEATYDSTSVNAADDCVKIPLQRNPNWCVKKYTANKFISKRLPSEKELIPLEDYEATNIYPLSIEQCNKEPSPLEGYRIVDLGYVLEWSVTLQFEHTKICTQGKLKIKEERRRELGLVSQIVLDCDMCDKIFRYTTEDPEKSILNIAAVWGTLATGSTYSHFDELISTMNIPSMPANMFYKIEEELGDEWYSSLWTSMEAAALSNKG